MASPLIFAAPDWLNMLVPIIFFVLYGIGQLMANKDPAKPKPVPRRPRPEGGVNLGDAPPQEPIKLEDTLRSEVEDFMRRVQGKEPLPEEPPVIKDIPKPKRQNVPDRPRWSESNPQEKFPRRQPKPLPEVELVDDETRAESRERIAKRPTAENRGVGMSRGSRQKQLSGEVAMADQRLEAQMQAKFQHRLGKLEHREELVVKAANTVAADVVKMLRSPEGMKQLVIASEILRRPEF